jgi:UDP-N-acetylglucosamine/UDP-N-acetylgalactosamine diphosphorylase
MAAHPLKTVSPMAASGLPLERMLTKLEQLRDRGVRVHAPATVWVDEKLNPEKFEAGAEIFPGARLAGERTSVGSGSRIGLDGPVTLRDTAVGRDVTLASGTFEGCVFLDGSSFGPSGHGRQGTLFEEGASAAHAVGTKQTILFPFATLGSNINFCDALLAGGTSRKDHSEVGSGFIHFNFTPYGPVGDKATPSCFGDVARGVWLRERRIFLGGAGGVVGPVRIGFGTVLAAGSVFRKDRGESRLVYSESLPPTDRDFDPRLVRRAPERVRKNLEYLAELFALRVFYAGVRARFFARDTFAAAVQAEALKLLSESVLERCSQIRRFLDGVIEALPEIRKLGGETGALEALEAERIANAWSRAEPTLLAEELLGTFVKSMPAPLVDATERAACGNEQYAGWIRSLDDASTQAGRTWLASATRAYLQLPMTSALL